MNKKRKFHFDLGTILTFAFVAIYCFIILYMLFFCVITSLKDNYDFALDHNIFGFPNWKKYPFSFKNFANASEYMKIQIRGRQYATVIQQFINTIVYAIGSVICALLIKAMPSYFCAKYKTKLGKVLYTIVIVTMILPIVGAMPATIVVMRKLNLYNKFLGIILYNSSFTGIYFLVFYAAFKALPDTYAEAARMDGAGHFVIFFKIYLPLIVPNLFAVGVMLFISFWNDYQTPLVYLPSHPTISYGLYRFTRTSRSANAPALMSACLMVGLPMVIMFAICKNAILNNITEGGIKG